MPITLSYLGRDFRFYFYWEVRKITSFAEWLHRLIIVTFVNSLRVGLRHWFRISLDDTICSKRRETKFFVDVGQLRNSSGISGINRVTYQVAKWLTETNGHFPDVILISKSLIGKNFFILDSWQDSLGELRLRPTRRTPIFAPGDIYLSLSLDHYPTALRTKLFLQMKERRIRTVFVLYDLLPIQMPEFFVNGLTQKWLHQQLLATMAASSQVVCISKTVEQEFRDWLETHNIPRMTSISSWPMGNQINVLSEQSPNSEIKALFERSVPVIISVGTIEPRKGLLATLNALEVLEAEGLDFIFITVGKNGWMSGETLVKLRKLQGDKFFWFEGLGDSDLDFLYSKADLCIAASHGEGYGLPLTEAQMHGCKVLARDIPVHREIAAPATHFFELDTPKPLAQSIALALQSQRNNDREKVETLSWKESTSHLISLISGVIPLSEKIDPSEC